jgi:hypothetical protein
MRAVSGNVAGLMVRLTLAAAVLPVAVLSASSPASANEVEFRGGGYVRNFSTECAVSGFTDPVYVSSIYRPRKLGTNGDATRISFFFPQFYATSYELPKGKLGNTFKKVVGGATGTATYFFSKNPRMRLTAMTPAKVKMRTPVVSLSGEIKNFDGIEGCKADFELSLRLQP